ncbi:glycosyltransferase family 4 protein [Chitinophaga sedimenti]|uniref:glycosyltransferase family 4 protein n=1 Tax=Chitinophaga sedimenti TaxID=2033606 RepID=UPI0020043D7A|nr:glycosyltransferase family 4 protein [Chitinophaga sedimenti]MCK7554472.1 glycosyltransferase family 4 protein [Chitinophaga sedimenti]
MHISYFFEHAREYDILHNHFDFLPLTYTPFVKTPMVTTIHGFSSQQIVPVYQRFNHNNHYVSISNSDRHASLHYAATVYNGLDVSSFKYVEAPAGDYLLFLGRIHPHKGTADAIRIAQRSGRRIIIAGIVQDAAYFREQVEPLLDNEQVKYIGPVGPAERNTLLGNALALLHPIHFDEPFGLSVAEAMLCGTPVIAYKRGSMPELIEHGRTGFLVATEDEAVEAVSMLGGLQRMDCREHAAAKFSKEKMVADYISVYERMLG